VICCCGGAASAEQALAYLPEDEEQTYIADVRLVRVLDDRCPSFTGNAGVRFVGPVDEAWPPTQPDAVAFAPVPNADDTVTIARIL
jgi:hypothetical protein